MRKLLFMIFILFLASPASAINVALSIDHLVPAAKYAGSTTSNTEEQYNNLEWQDKRQQPTWSELQDAWLDYQAEQEENERQEIINKANNLEFSQKDVVIALIKRINERLSSSGLPVITKQEIVEQLRSDKGI